MPAQLGPFCIPFAMQATTLTTSAPSPAMSASAAASCRARCGCGRVQAQGLGVLSATVVALMQHCMLQATFAWKQRRSSHGMSAGQPVMPLALVSVRWCSCKHGRNGAISGTACPKPAEPCGRLASCLGGWQAARPQRQRATVASRRSVAAQLASCGHALQTPAESGLSSVW